MTLIDIISLSRTNKRYKWKLQVPLCCGCDGIHNLYDAMQGRVRPNGHVSATEVVVNGAHHANNVEVGGRLGLIGCDFTWAQIQTSTPFQMSSTTSVFTFG